MSQIIETLLAKKLVEDSDLDQLLFGKAQSQLSETRKFIVTRLVVMFDNFIDQVKDIDQFDYLSKVLLELTQQVLEKKDKPVDYLAECKTILMGKLLVKAMRDQEELQLHYKKLADQFTDITLVGLIGLNELLAAEESGEDIKRKTLYSILSDFEVFDEIKKVKTTLIVHDDDDVEEGKLSEFGVSLLKRCKN